MGGEEDCIGIGLVLGLVSGETQNQSRPDPDKAGQQCEKKKHQAETACGNSNGEIPVNHVCYSRQWNP